MDSCVSQNDRDKSTRLEWPSRKSSPKRETTCNLLAELCRDQSKGEHHGEHARVPLVFPLYAAFLLNRFRVLEKVGKTSCELATGHAYRGKLALFGESVMFKKLTKYEANDIFERGVWVGQHSWNDHHVVLTAAGAFEARTTRRLAAEEAFIASDLVIVKGLPWAYSPQGILMKHAGAAQRYRQPTLEAEATEEELKAVRDAVAAGVVTPAPGLQAQPSTPGFAGGAPATPAVIPMTPRAKRSLETEEAGPDAKKLDDATSPRRNHEKRTTDEASDSGDEKRQKINEETSAVEESSNLEPPRGVVRTAEEGGEAMASASPNKSSRLYRPHYAGIQAIEAHGDEELGADLIRTRSARSFLQDMEEKKMRILQSRLRNASNCSTVKLERLKYSGC